MLKKILAVSCLLATTLSVQAGVISHKDYKRHHDSNIVTGVGLEWLKWDVTRGMSINSALATYSAQGWRLASNIEMATLFNDFQFTTYKWTDTETTVQNRGSFWGQDENNQNPFYGFISLFGTTYLDSCSVRGRTNYCYADYDPYIFSLALYGSDLNKNNMFNRAHVRDDFTLINNGPSSVDRVATEATLAADWYTATETSKYIGIALVRSIAPAPVAVHTPATIGLFALGLCGLLLQRRRNTA